MNRFVQTEPHRVINPLLNAQKLRDLTYTWQRHTVRRAIRPEDDQGYRKTYHTRIRQNPADYFFIFCRQIIPQLEEKIEMNLLEKFKRTLKSDLERKEVENAYMQRKDNLARVRAGDDMDLNRPEDQLEKVLLPLHEYNETI